MGTSPTHPPALSEQQIEARLRLLLGVLNRRVNRLYASLGAGWLVLMPVTVCLLGQVLIWWTAILGGLAIPAALLAALGAGGEALLGRCSALRFNEQFPEATPERAVALNLLAELRSLRK